MPLISIPNEAALQTTLIATETIPGVAATPTARLLGDFTASPGIGQIRRSEDSTGGYDRTATARRQFADPSGSYAEDLTFESFPQLLRYGIVGGDPATGDSETVEAFTRVQSPAFNSDNIDTFTAQYGVEGFPWQATGVRWDEFTITADSTNTNDNWQFSTTPFIRDADALDGFSGVATGGSTTTIVMTSAGWTVDQWAGAYVFQDAGTHIGEMRQIVSNTADTLTLEAALSETAGTGDVFYIAPLFPVVADPDYETITLEGTKLFLDAYNASASTIGTTDISERILSMNITVANQLARKRRFPGIIARVGRGAREISGTIRFELDRRDEYDNLQNNDDLSIRLEKQGSVIDAGAGTFNLAQIDIEKAVFDTWSPDTDNNNMTVSLAFVALLESPIVTFTSVNTLAALA